MKLNRCILQKISKNMLAVLMLIATIGFAVSGLTIVPGFGLVLALPVSALSLYFFSVHLNDQCEIDLSAH